MDTLTIKIPSNLAREIVEASSAEHVSKSELVRRALETYLSQRHPASPCTSALDRAGDLVGCFEGPEDLASNPAHLEGFGKV